MRRCLLSFLLPLPPSWKWIITLTLYGRDIKGMPIAWYRLFLFQFQQNLRQGDAEATSDLWPSYQQPNWPTMRVLPPRSALFMSSQLLWLLCGVPAKRAGNAPLASSGPSAPPGSAGPLPASSNSSWASPCSSLTSCQPEHWAAARSATTLPPATLHAAPPRCLPGVWAASASQSRRAGRNQLGSFVLICFPLSRPEVFTDHPGAQTRHLLLA